MSVMLGMPVYFKNKESLQEMD